MFVKNDILSPFDKNRKLQTHSKLIEIMGAISDLHCITIYYAQQEISWKSGKTSKFQPLHSTIQIWTDFHEIEAEKKNFEKKKSKIADFSKWPFFKIANWSLG